MTDEAKMRQTEEIEGFRGALTQMNRQQRPDSTNKPQSKGKSK
jgi:hypothetical protein